MVELLTPAVSQKVKESPLQVVITHLLEEQRVLHVLGVDRGQSVLVLSRNIDLISSQNVADCAELLDFALEHLLQPLVPQLRAFHLLSQICNTQ